MIKLKTDCDDCVHVKVCQYKNNPKFAMAKLKGTTFKSDTPGDIYTWEDKMVKDHVDIEFSCSDFEKKQQALLR